jgi:hypothetical protein
MLFLNDVWTNRHPRCGCSKAEDRVLANRQRPARFVVSAIKKLREIVFAITIVSVIMALLAALDIWIWVPHMKSFLLELDGDRVKIVSGE